MQCVQYDKNALPSFSSNLLVEILRQTITKNTNRTVLYIHAKHPQNFDLNTTRKLCTLGTMHE